MKKQFVKNLAVTFLLLGAATAFAFLFFHFGHKNSANIALFYILALILISLYTDGYFYGITAALFGVVAVNYFFSYPYFKINFTLDGYPVTFIGMLAISLITSAITSSMKRQKHLIAERERKLMEADKEKLRANLLRAVSHDLRTPLTSIIGSSSSYLENYTDLSEAERTELVSNIKEDSEWLLNMVENLLTVTRISGNTGKVKKSLEVVEEVVSEAIVRLQKRHPDMKVTVTMPNDFLMLPLDATLIEQVLINLLENSYIHSKSKEPSDLIIIENPDSVTFTIRDYGIGLDEAQLPFIFEGQYSSDASDGHKGIGIGLSICKTIVQAHDGHIAAANHGHGAEFSFTLPKEKEENNAA
ncbi:MULTISPECIES: sensor histidine kinase [Lachnospiraceae]|jgi:two-component system sensor histidine kinase KdpD|uniref:histidine kinase n=1 Tax=Faecalicatena acetigenes TaxID=2981790 RepID=A0ABT2TAB0_9FIRM|nr:MULTISPECIES: DUF4118 domain-containing protein [Lachnospiraceae]MCU6746916.1 DUF4118 domain-containing protein [Faecalicatena acetigenes]RGT74218.1 DUF4118 domain-containing protein [Ruminococcus sp. AF18-22]SCH51030.1 Sensor protein KdpD [uncultured Clostridium sp.]